MPAATEDVHAGARKAATLLALLPDEAASDILRHLSGDEIEAIGIEMARMQELDLDEVQSVATDYLRRAANQGVYQAGLPRFGRLLTASRGAEADRLIERVERARGRSEIDVASMDPAALAGVLEAEPPQVIALVLSRFEPRAAAAVISRLSAPSRLAVAKRLARMDTVDDDTLDEVLGTLSLRAASLRRSFQEPADGVRSLASILDHLSAEDAGALLEGLEGEDEELASMVRERSLDFEDVLFISDRSMATVVQRIDKKALAMALKGTTEEIQGKFFRGMSSRAGDGMREEMQLLGPVRLAEVEKAQEGIMQTVKTMIDEKVIVLNKGGDDFVT